MGSERGKAVAVREPKKAPSPAAPTLQEPTPTPLAPMPAGPPGGNVLFAFEQRGKGTPIGFVPEQSPLDPIVEGNELARAIDRNDHEGALAVLRRNANPRDMYAMIRNYSGDMVRLLARMPNWSDSQWRRAQAYLGDQVPLDLQITKHAGDRDAVFADLARISDDQALGLLIEDSRLDWIEIKPAEGEPIPPARARRDDVARALHGALDASGYFDAMRLLLRKAERASKRSRAATATPEPMTGSLQLVSLGTWPLSIVELPALGDPSTVESVIVDAVQVRRVDLAIEIIRDADAKDWDKDSKARSRGYLALAELDLLERRMAVPRLTDAITHNRGDVSTLEQLASNPDDATMIRELVRSAATRGGVLIQTLDDSALRVALERAGGLLQGARTAAEAAPAGTEEEAKKRAEVTRMEGALLDWDMMVVLRGEPAQLEARLRALGATPLQIGVELLRQTSSNDFAAIIATVKRIAPAVRIDAIDQSGMLDQLGWLDANQRELLGAYLSVAFEPQQHPTATKLVSPPASHALAYAYGRAPDQLPFVRRDGPLVLDLTAPRADFRLLQHDLYAARPRTTIAIAQILDDLGHDRPAAALGVILRLDEADRTEVYADTRVRDAIERVSDSWAREALHEAWWNAQVELGVLAKRSGNSQAIFEAISARATELGNPELRRGFVLAQRLAANPSLELTDKERSQIREYEAALSWGNPLSGWQDKETFKQLLFGQPQVVGGLDPTAEAEFMVYRIAERAGARKPRAAGQALQDAFGSAGPTVDEAIARFETYYNQVKEGGVTVSELAQLGELYHAAMRALDHFLAENESFAHRAARIVGGVVATVIVIAATAGGATPFVIGALAGLGAGAAEAATGAAIRTESSLGQVATDFAAGTVEGIAMAAGNALAARAVAALGVGGSELAVRAGGEAMRKVSHGFFASIVENSIAGAIGGASAEIFETAVDRATWDRGIAEAFTKILAAAARGAALGGITGGVLSAAFHGIGAVYSRLVQRHGAAVAKGVTEMLEASGADAAMLERLAQHAEDDLARAWELVEAQRYAEAEKVLDAINVPANARAAMLEFARVRVAIRTVGELGALPEGAIIKPQILAAEDFTKAVGNQRGDAAVVIRNGRPEILVKRGAAPSVIREEMVHVVQFYTDPVMRARMLLLSEENLAEWATKSATERAELYVAKLEVEADAQRRILTMLEEDVAVGDREATLRALDAQETLGNLNEKLGAARLARAGGALEALAPEAAPMLFARGAQTPRISKRAAADIKRLVTKGRGLNVNNAKDLKTLERFGYVPGKTADGTIFRVSRLSEATETMPHLQVEANGKIVIGERPSFAEQRIDAAEQWRATTEAIESLPQRLRSKVPGIAGVAQTEKQSLAVVFHEQLAKKVAKNELDEASAGLLLKWGNVVEELDKRVGASVSKRVLNELVAEIPSGTLTQAQVDELRRLVRARTVEYLKTIRSGEQRITALREMLELQPDPGSRGALFTEYRRGVLLATQDQPGGSALFGPREPVHAFDLPGGIKRTPDDAVTLAKDLPGLRKGRYAIEDKAGEHAFKVDQARDYARGVSKPTSDYDGILYVFSNKTEARAAYEAMERETVIAKLLGKQQRGIHVSYFDDRGLWTLFEP